LGWGTEKSAEEGDRHYDKVDVIKLWDMADKNKTKNAHAQFHYGWMAYLGKAGLERNPIATRLLLGAAAFQGHAFAQNMLPFVFPQCRKSFQGEISASAKYDIGVYFESEKIGNAWYWYSKAAEEGCTQAEVALRRIQRMYKAME
jgi:TPR repeat protein